MSFKVSHPAHFTSVPSDEDFATGRKENLFLLWAFQKKPGGEDETSPPGLLATNGRFVECNGLGDHGHKNRDPEDPA